LKLLKLDRFVQIVHIALAAFARSSGGIHVALDTVVKSFGHCSDFSTALEENLAICLDSMSSVSHSLA